jgi:hypothetical protein
MALIGFLSMKAIAEMKRIYYMLLLVSTHGEAYFTTVSE